MRQVLSISLPENLVKQIKNRVKNKGFNSVSEYFKHLFEEDSNNIISEKELLADIKQAEAEYAQGKTIKAESISDLL